VNNITKGKRGVGGRTPAVSDDIKEQLIKQAKQKDRAKDSFTNKTFKAVVEEMRVEEAQQHGKNPLALKALSKSALQRVRAEVLPESIKRGRSQNERRFEALIDLQNHVGLAAGWKAVLAKEDAAEELRGDRMFNFDSTSILLETSADDKDRLYMAEGSRAQLRKLGLTPSTTQRRANAKYKKRCVQMQTLTRADGVLNCVLVLIKDFSFTETVRHKVQLASGPAVRRQRTHVLSVCVPSFCSAPALQTRCTTSTW
jgi:hypothetical protein